MNRKKWRVLVGEFHQETNSFCPQTWGMSRFEEDTLLEGPAIFPAYQQGSGRVLGGIISEALTHHAEIIPGCAMRATSGGPVEKEVVDHFLNAMLRALRTQGPFDALILGFHGATQSTAEDDVCGSVLQKLRRAAGPDTVISAGFDLHANITARCLAAADYISGFQTFPHTDQIETGARAARLAFMHLGNEKALYRACITLPMIVPAGGYSTLRGYFSEIMRNAKQMTADGRLIDVSVFQMQPWLDVSPAGSAVITISDREENAARCASELAHALYGSRDSFRCPLMDVREVIGFAEKAVPGHPVILVDLADSAGGGSLGDSAYAAVRLREMGCPVRTAMALSDPRAVRRAFETGIGGRALFDIGGTLSLGAPRLTGVWATVMGLHDGVFYQEGPAGAGQRRNLGKTAVLRAGNMDILVCEHICGAGDTGIYRSFGIEPSAYQLVIVKANTSFRAGYEPFASRICLTDTPGAGSPDLLHLPYRHLPENMYPFVSFDPDAVSEPAVICCTNRRPRTPGA